ncbi:hypothetical protein LLG46_15635 [bacterium]|nr:hypothetical protein [bacterium]
MSCRKISHSAALLSRKKEGALIAPKFKGDRKERGYSFPNLVIIPGFYIANKLDFDFDIRRKLELKLDEERLEY